MADFLQPEKRMACNDCKYCEGYISLWCTNKDAVKARRTAIPGVFNCPFWKPNEDAVKRMNANIAIELIIGEYYLGIKVIGA